MTTQLPTVIAGWTLLKLMGEGSFGQVWKVYRVTPTSEHLIRVMKLPLAGGVADPTAGHRWLGEARILLKTQLCGNVVTVIDVGIDRGIYYILMEFVQGTDLARLLKLMRKANRPMPVGAAVFVAGQMMLGLGQIHAMAKDKVPQNIIHKDIAPKNVLLSMWGAVKITDFGISTARDVKATNAGTLRYMAPEQHEGYPTQRSDVYSAGIVMWEMLEMAPYRSGDEDVARRQIFAPTPRPLTRQGLPPGAVQLLMAALDPLERNRPTALEFVATLKETKCYLPEETLVGAQVRAFVTDLGDSGQTGITVAAPVERTPNLVGLLAARDEKLARGTIDTDEMLAAAKARAARAGDEDANEPQEPATVREPAEPPLVVPQRFVGLVDQLVVASPLPPVVWPDPGTERLSASPRVEARHDSGHTALILPPETSAPSRTDPLPLEARGVPIDVPAAACDVPVVPRFPARLEPRAIPAIPDVPVARPRAANTERRWVAPVVALDAFERGGDTAPHEGASTTASVAIEDSSRAVKRRFRRTVIAVLGGATLTTTLGGWALLHHLEPDAVATPTHASAHAFESLVVERPEHVQEPVLDPVELGSSTPDTIAEVGPALPPATPVLDARVAAAGAVPAATTAAAIVQDSTPRPKVRRTPARAVETISVTFYRDFISGFDVTIGRHAFTVSVDRTVEIPAGVYRVKWREHGTKDWKDAGKLELVAGKRHVLRFGAIGEHGFHHRALEPKR